MPYAPKQLKTKTKTPTAKRSDYGRDWERLVRQLRAERTVYASDRNVSLCVECERDGKPFRLLGPRELHADHILPICTHPHLRLHRGNIQLLCRAHHSAKTIRGE